MVRLGSAPEMIVETAERVTAKDMGFDAIGCDFERTIRACKGVIHLTGGEQIVSGFELNVEISRQRISGADIFGKGALAVPQAFVSFGQPRTRSGRKRSRS